MPTVKIYGYGWVGKAMHTLFPNASIQDPQLGLKAPEIADFAFVCVPTPLKNGMLDTSIVQEVVMKAKEPIIIIRSTVNPTNCAALERLGKEIVYQPEYLGETVNHPMTDQHKRPFLILGGSPKNRRKVIELYQSVYNAEIKIRQMSAYEAEIVKLSENRAIAFKVAECQELYDLCEVAGVDYYVIREAVYGDDPRFNMLWSFIYPEKRGFQSKCLPKDVYAWASFAESLGYDAKITKALIDKNEEWIKE